MEKFLFRRADILNARQLEFGKFFDLDRRLWLGYWLECARRSGLSWEGLLGIAAIRRIPAPVRIDLCLAETIQVVVDGVFGIEA